MDFCNIIYYLFTIHIPQLGNKIDFDLTEIKQHKGNFDIGNSRYNAKYFVSCAEALGKDTVFYQNEEITRPSYFEGNAGIGLILPCRK